MKQFIVILIISNLILALKAQNQVIGLPNQWSSMYYYDALQFSVGNHFYIGGRSSQGPLTWNAYPGNQKDHFHFRYNNTNATQLTYSDWNGLWEFKVSKNTPIYSGLVSWKTIMYINRWDQVGVNGNLRINSGSLTVSDTGDDKLSITTGSITSNIPLIISNSELRIKNNGITQFKVKSSGEIRCRSVKVDLDHIPDYVFDDDYSLMTIENLSSYIKEKKHLPNIPSAKDYEKRKAVDLGELNRLLLEKVEEQTLYIISINQQVKDLKQYNKQLLNRLKRIESKLDIQNTKNLK